MSPNMTMRILDSFTSTLKDDYIWIEDIFLTGILRQKENVSLIDVEDLFITKYEAGSSFIAAHLDYLNPNQRLEFWKTNIKTFE